MKRIYAITLAATGAALSLCAQTKFDFSAAQLLQNVEINETATAKARSGIRYYSPAPQVKASQKFLTAVKITDASAIDEMLSRGYELENTTGTVILCYLTPAQIKEVAELETVKSVSLGSELEPLMSMARATTGVDVIHSGGEETGGRAFTGKGVVAGIMDTGLQPNHVNFLDENKEPRISRLWVITGSMATQDYDTPTKIKNYTTDDSEATHATHVLGILGGSYKGNGTNGGTSQQAGKVAMINPSTGKRISSSVRPVPYYGVATDADLAVCIGTLQSNNITLAAQKVKDYAEQQGKPAVFNMSLGHNNGPHDGTTVQNQRLAELGKDMLICISAGNEGDYQMSYNKQFTASDRTVKSTLSRSSSANGYVDVWGDNSSLLTFSFVAVDKTTGDIKYTYTLNTNTNGQTRFIGGSGQSGYTNVTVVPDLDTYFGAKALINFSSQIDPNNNRYHVECHVDLPGVSRSNIVPGVIVEGRAGNGVNLYTGSQGQVQLYSNDIAGFVDGNADASINDIGCGDNVLIVGAYVNSNSFPVLNYSGFMQYNEEQGAIASFSSWGKVYGGEQLPHVAGPGMGMISSYSRYYMQNFKPDQTGTDYDYRVGDVFAGVDKASKAAQYDYYAEMSGTSMSSPFVAGVLALWLEADPTLTMDRVKEIIRKTADHDDFTKQHPERWGMGKINALAGLKEILSSGSINDVKADDAADNLIVEALGGKRYSVFVGGTDGFTVNLYNMQGILAATAGTDGNAVEVDASALADGIYLLEVQGRNIHTSRKIMVK